MADTSSIYSSGFANPPPPVYQPPPPGFKPEVVGTQPVTLQMSLGPPGYGNFPSTTLTLQPSDSGLLTPGAGAGGLVQLNVVLPASVMVQTSPVPCNVTCPVCQRVGMTYVEKRTGSNAYFSACLLTMVGCCCLLPWMWEGLKDAVHFCSHCKAELGTYRRPRQGGGRRVHHGHLGHHGFHHHHHGRRGGRR